MWILSSKSCFDSHLIKLGIWTDSLFSLIFPQWDVIAIILAIFLLTYTYIEARSNYHRGSTLVLSYVPPFTPSSVFAMLFRD